MTEKEKEILLKTARAIISGKTKHAVDPDRLIKEFPLFSEKRGCFVSIHKGKDLRGCIGYILPVVPLIQAVIENAFHCAYNDPRFNPVSAEELGELLVEISILSVPEAMQYSTIEELLSQLHPEKDGVIISAGRQSATFLPQVWEQLREKDAFLTHLCYKAGLNPDEWKKGKLKVETYQAEVFSEK